MLPEVGRAKRSRNLLIVGEEDPVTLRILARSCVNSVERDLIVGLLVRKLEDCRDPGVKGAAWAVRRGRDADARAIANFINLVE